MYQNRKNKAKKACKKLHILAVFIYLFYTSFAFLENS